MEEINRWKHQDSSLLTALEIQSDAGSTEIGQRARVLKDLALALLNEVQTLGDPQSLDVDGSIDFYDEVRRFEIELINRALKKTGGHQMRAARLLNVKVTTLNSMIKRYQIRPDAQIFSYPAIQSRVEGLRKRA